MSTWLTLSKKPFYEAQAASYDGWLQLVAQTSFAAQVRKDLIPQTEVRKNPCSIIAIFFNSLE